MKNPTRGHRSGPRFGIGLREKYPNPYRGSSVKGSECKLRRRIKSFAPRNQGKARKRFHIPNSAGRIFSKAYTPGNHRRALEITARRTANSPRENPGGISRATPPFKERRYMPRWALDTAEGSPDSTSRKEGGAECLSPAGAADWLCKYR